MIVRFILGIVLAFIMARPRPNEPDVLAQPAPLPPTGPPGFEGEWNPEGAQDAPRDPELPPTGPPGYEGDWPPTYGEPPISYEPKPIESGRLTIRQQVALVRALLGQGFSFTETIRIVRAVDAALGSQLITPQRDRVDPYSPNPMEVIGGTRMLPSPDPGFGA